MRQPADLTRIKRFMRALGDAARRETRVYFTGGATAVLHGWRDSTIDIDIKIVPDRDELLRTVRPNQPFEEWLRLQELDGLLTQGRRAGLGKAFREVRQVFASGAGSLVEAFAKGVGSGLAGGVA